MGAHDGFVPRRVVIKRRRVQLRLRSRHHSSNVESGVILHLDAQPLELRPTGPGRACPRRSPSPTSSILDDIMSISSAISVD